MKTIKLGSQGHEVAALQSRLGITPDGIFGQVTLSAVRAWQKEHGLTVDGIVGPHTWDTLGFASAPRIINEIIIHCSATKEGTNVSSASIDKSHKARKFSS